MKPIFLTLGLTALLTPLAAAQDTTAKPAPAPPVAAAVPDTLTEREKAVLGTYKAEQAGAPVITIKAQGKQLILAATGYPEIPVTLGEKDALTSAALPGDYAFTVLRDKDGAVTGLDVKSPAGDTSFKKQAEPTAKKPVVPDVLGKYTPDKPGPLGDAEITLQKDGSLLISVDGQPDFPITVGKDDTILSPRFPDGVSAKFTRDDKGTVNGVHTQTPEGLITFTRKTFPKPPGAVDPAIERLKGVVGSYRSETPGIPTVTAIFRDGKLYLQAEGNPEIEVSLDDKDRLTGPQLPSGFELSLVRNKDGKVTGLDVKTPMGDITMTRTPPKEDKPAEDIKKPA
jgi:hypothetical protein